MSKRGILLLTLVGSLCLGLFLWRSPPKEFSELMDDQATTPNYPTSFITQAHTKQYDEKGQLSYSLKAKTINYYEDRQPNQPEIFLEQPYLTLYEYDEQNPNRNTITTISAEAAEGSEKNDLLTLMTNVEIKQTGRAGAVTTLNTERLTIQPNRRYAETDKPVIIVDNTGTTSATGLKVFFDEKRIELLSKVKGKYVPQ